MTNIFQFFSSVFSELYFYKLYYSKVYFYKVYCSKVYFFEGIFEKGFYAKCTVPGFTYLLSFASLFDVTPSENSFISLMFERVHGWNGLLVEPHPVIFAKVTVEKRAIPLQTAGTSSTEEGLECSNVFVCQQKVSFVQGLILGIFCYPSHFRPHLAKFASEASPGSMAGLVPNGSLVNGTMEVGNCGRIYGGKI